MRVLVLLLLLAAAASAARGWRRLPDAKARAPENPHMPLVFSVAQPRIAELAGIVVDRATPSSPNYGRWLSRAEVAAYAAPPASTAAVVEALRAHGASNVTELHGGAYVRAHMPRAVVESMFRTSISAYIHDETDRVIWRGESHEIPAALHEHVSHVLGISDFPVSLRRLSCPRVGETCPAALRDAYGIAPALSPHGGRIVIFNDASSGELYAAADLATYLARYTSGTSVTVNVIGDNSGAGTCGGPSYRCAEAALDVQTAAAVLGNGTIDMFMSQGIVGEDSLFDFFAVLQTMDCAGCVASISYGGDERENSRDYQVSMYNEAVKAAAMGITIVAASGDQGVQGFLDACTRFSAIMPASNPFVLAVGATAGVENAGIEIAASTETGARITSGGGFSEIFGRPSYQTPAVAAYLAAGGLPASSAYSGAGRAYPDVAAAGRAFPIVLGGAEVYVDGTSASTPVVAAQLARINAARMHDGRTALGLAQPFLYDLPDVCFNDVTSGNNRCGDSGQACCATGFPTAAGWDAVTGRGSMRYDCVLAYALNTTYTAVRAPFAPQIGAAGRISGVLGQMA